MMYFLIFSVVVSLILNGFALTIKLLSKRRIQATNVLFVAMSISDTLLSLFVHPMIIATSFGHEPKDFFSPTGCNWYGFAAVFFGGFNMCMHGTIAYSRYKNIVDYKDGKWKNMTIHLRLLALGLITAFVFALGKLYRKNEFFCFITF